MTGPSDALPSEIGQVAVRALTMHGITTLTDLTTVTRGELLAMHGVGPKAVGTLETELSARGLAFGD